MAVAVPADVSDTTAVEATVAEVTETLGTVDVLVNNAGTGDAGPFLDRSDDGRFEANLAVHLRGAIHCIGATVDAMVDGGYDKVITIASMHTINGVGTFPESDAAKYGLLGLTKSLALELGREGPGERRRAGVDRHTDHRRVHRPYP